MVYSATINFYNEYTDKEEKCCVMVIASNWADAMEKISHNFDGIESVKIDLVRYAADENSPLIYIPEDCIEKIVDENSF